MIKKFLLAATVALTATTAQANKAFCLSIYTHAGSLMEAIQAGRQLPKQLHLEIIAEMYADQDEPREFLSNVVERAHVYPRYYRESQREEVIPAFAERIHADCVKQFVK